MYKTLHKKQGSVTVQLRFARSSVTFCAKRDIKYGTYNEEQNSRLASGHNLKPVTTNFTGRKPDEIYADFVFIDDGKYLIKCKNNCVPEERIFLKTWVRKRVFWKSVGCTKQLHTCKQKNSLNTHNLEIELRQFHLFSAKGIM